MDNQEKPKGPTKPAMQKTPHDAAVKKSFEDLVLAAMFFRLILPQYITNKINWDTLELLKDTFVTDTLKRNNLDLLFRVQLVDNRALCLMLVFEHKSYLPGLNDSIDLQLMNYQMAVYNTLHAAHVRNNEALHEADQQGQALKLPKVVPVVLYHGNRKWNLPNWQQMTEVAGVPEADALPGLSHSYILHDLHAMTDQELQQFYSKAARLLLVALCLKHSHDDDFIGTLPRLYQLAKEATAPNEAVEIIDALAVYLGYLVEPEQYQYVLQITGQIDNALNNKVMNIIEAAELRGEAKGEARGIAKGEARGIAKGEANQSKNMAIKMLHQAN